MGTIALPFTLLPEEQKMRGIFDFKKLCLLGLEI
jgi:hypothetical protein